MPSCEGRLKPSTIPAKETWLRSAFFVFPELASLTLPLGYLLWYGREPHGGQHRQASCFGSSELPKCQFLASVPLLHMGRPD